MPDPVTQPELTNSQKLATMLATKTPPAHTGKPVFGKYIEHAKAAGAHSPGDLFGHAEKSGDVVLARNLNFGSKSDCAMLDPETRFALFSLKKMMSNVSIQASFMFKTANPTAEMMMQTSLYKTHLEPALKAFDLAGFATWAPQVQARFYFEEYEVPLMVVALFDSMPMQSLTENVPGALGRLFGLLETDSATFTVQSNTAANYIVTAKDCVLHTEITQDLNQDSSPAIIDKLRKEVVAGIGRSEERTLLDGDVTSTHMDSDVTAATDFRKAYNGVRKRAFDNTANGVVYDHGGDAPSKELFRQLFKKMKRFSYDKADLAWLMGTSIGTDLVTGAIPELFTAFAFGGPASNVTGEVPPVFGVRGAQSEWIREDLGATGVYTGAGNSFTWLGLVKKSRFMNHVRAPIRVWAAPSLPSSDKMLMTAKKRMAFGGTPQSSDEKSIVIGINVATDV